MPADLPEAEVHVWAVGPADLRHVLARYVDEPAESLRFGTEPRGKPFLAHDSGVRFNLSHSGPMALVAVARREVGVDVERRRTVAHEARVARRIMTADELVRYDALPEAERTAFLLRVWTRKEALLKASGEGIRRSLQSLACEPAPSDRWQVVDLDVPGCVAAVAAEGADWVPVLHDGAKLAP